MIDLHSHVLPGVDDGACDFEQALAMCRLAAADGCTTIVATPHLRHEQFWNDDRNQLTATWRQLRKLASDVIDVRLGGEIAVNTDSLAEVDQLPGGQLLSMAETDYVLLEFPFYDLGMDPVEVIYEVSISGKKPILAHPERIEWLAQDLDLLAALVAQGATCQLTAACVIGGFGRQLQDVSNRMIERQLIHYVASDTHDEKFRPPGLAAAHNWIERHWGAPVSQAFFVDNPRAVLENRPVDSVGAADSEAGDEPEPSRPSFARRLFSKGQR